MAAQFPSKVVSNEDILNMIRENSTEFVGDLDHTLKLVLRQLKASGSGTRRWLADGETSLQHTVEACKKAMAEMNDGDKIDLLIVASVYSELVEPATSNLVASALGLDHVECFDVLEACDGWMKAVKIASAFIESGQYKRVMVVNPEFGMTPGFGAYPEPFALKSIDQLEWRLPVFTIGEVATAVILGPDSSNKWQFTNHTRNDLFDYCSITHHWNGETISSLSSALLAKDGAGIFTSFGAKLKEDGFPLAISQFKISGIRPEDVNILFTHSSSKRDWSEVAQVIGLSDKIYDVYAGYGNVVSAAVPAAMALAVEEGKLKRGQSVLALVASAGMSFSTASFTF
jgi:3-oxoacyl-[acyl-carrier-protein] synthase III